MNSWSLEYSVDVDETARVVYAKIFGSWKAHHAEGYHEEFEEKSRALWGKPWAKLIDLTSWKTSYPDVVEKVAEHMHWSREHGCVLSIYAVNQPSTFRQLREMIVKAGITEEAKVVRTIDEGRAYLDEQWLKKGQKTSK